MSTRHTVWIIGDASVDLVPASPTTYLKCPGGASANVAVCLSRLGGHAEFIGCLGADDIGRFLQKTLSDNGVGVRSLRLDPAQVSAVLLVNLGENGERTFTYLVDPGAEMFVSSADLPAFKQHQWFYFNSIGLTQSPSREACLEGARRMLQAGGQVLFDVNLRVAMWRDPHEIRQHLRDAIRLSSICKVSSDELCWLGNVNHWQDAQHLIADLGCDTSIISLGSEGALLVSPSTTQHFPAPRVTPVDTTGAGDAFVGALLDTLSKAASWNHSSLAEAIVHANACGAIVVTEKGAMTALPSSQQLAVFRASHPL